MTTKADIVDHVYQAIEHEFTKREMGEMVDEAFDLMKDLFERGEDLKLSGFGKFKLRTKAARMGRNPKTGKVMEIAPRRVLTFSPSTILRDKLNGR